MPDPITSPSRVCIQIVDVLLRRGSWNSQTQLWLENQQIRMALWISQLGVFENGSQSVKHRLRQNTPVRQALSQLILAVLHNFRLLAKHWSENDKHPVPDDQNLARAFERLVTAASGQDSPRSESEDDDIEGCEDIEVAAAASDDEMDMASTPTGSEESPDDTLVALWMDRIAEDIDDLLRLASIIRQHGASKSNRRGEDFEPSVSDDPSDAEANDHVANRQDHTTLLSEKFSGFVDLILQREFGPVRFNDKKLDCVKARLKGGMMRRWRLTCYRHQRAQQFKRRASRAKDTLDTMSDSADELVDTKASVQTDTTIGNNDLQTVDATNDKRVTRSELSLGPATTLSSKFSVLNASRKESSPSKPSSRAGDIDIKLPPYPDIWASPNIYDCPYCDRFPIIKELNKSSWKRHLWHDLMPFICLYDDCNSAGEEFATIHAWSEHISSVHLSLSWTCSRCDGSDAKFLSEAAFKLHFSTLHRMTLTTAELETIADISRDEAILEQCLICGLKDGMTVNVPRELTMDTVQRRKNIVMCMATHLQILALGSLPWHFGCTVEAEDCEHNSVAAEFDDNEILLEGFEDRLGEPEPPHPGLLSTQPRESPTC